VPNESGSPDRGGLHRPGNDKEGTKRAFFGRRKGHSLKPRQAALFETLLPRLALDLTKPAPAKALVAIDERNLTNIRLYFGDASELLDWLPDASLSQIDLLYPDPWPKRRHWKRRFIQDDNLRRLARILKKGGELRFATDIADYAAYALARVFRSADFVWTAECADDWRRPWRGFGGTRYEAKAEREGRRPAYFIFRRM